MPVPQWAEVEKTLPPDISDEARDMARNQFFAGQLWPALLASGAKPTQLVATRNQFLMETERPKSASPRIAQAATAAAASFLRPIAGLIDDEKNPRLTEGLAKMEEARATEVQRQGLSGAGSVAAQMVGNLAGQVPYLLPFMRGARAVGAIPAVARASAAARGTAAAEGAGTLERAIAAATRRLPDAGRGALEGATSTAVYEAAANPKNRVSSAVQGAALGGAMGAVLEPIFGGKKAEPEVPAAKSQADTADVPKRSPADEAAFERLRFRQSGNPQAFNFDPRQKGKPQSSDANIVRSDAIEGEVLGADPPMPMDRIAARQPATVDGSVIPDPAMIAAPPGRGALPATGRPILPPSTGKIDGAFAMPGDVPQPPPPPLPDWIKPQAVEREIRKGNMDDAFRRSVEEFPQRSRLSALDETVSESPETIAVQVQQLVDGQRKVVMIPKNSDVSVAKPAGFRSTKVEGAGTFIYNPDLVTPAAIKSAAAKNELGDLLGSVDGGYGAPDKTMLGPDQVTVVARKGGVIAQEVLTDGSNLARTMSVMQRLGDDVRVETIEETIARRLAMRPDGEAAGVPAAAPADSFQLESPATQNGLTMRDLGIDENTPKEFRDLYITAIDRLDAYRRNKEAIDAENRQAIESIQGAGAQREAQAADQVSNQSAPTYPFVSGGVGRVVLPREIAVSPTEKIRKLDIRWALVDGSKIRPHAANQRDWSLEANIAALRQKSNEFEPELVTIPSISGLEGPPIAIYHPMDDGRLLTIMSGHGRTELISTLRREFRLKYEKFRADMRGRLKTTYGMSDADVELFDTMSDPRVVGIIERKSLDDVAQRELIDRMNEGVTTRLLPAEQARTDAKWLTPEVAGYMEDLLERGDGDLSKGLAGARGIEAYNFLYKQGAISGPEVNLFQKAGGDVDRPRLKERIMSAMLGKMFDSPTEMLGVSYDMTRKLMKAAPSVLRMADGSAWDVLPKLKGGIRLAREFEDWSDNAAWANRNLRRGVAASKEEDWASFIKLQNLEGRPQLEGYTAEEVAIARKLVLGKSLEFGQLFRDLADVRSISDPRGQMRLDGFSVSGATAEEVARARRLMVDGIPEEALTDEQSLIYANSADEAFARAFDLEAAKNDLRESLGDPGPSLFDGIYNTRESSGQVGQEAPMRRRGDGTFSGATGGRPIPGAPEGVSAVTWMSEDGSVKTLLSDINREDAFHEGMHRKIFQATAVTGFNPEAALGAVDKVMTGKLVNALPKGLYKDNAAEEIAVRLMTAIRLGDDETIERFVKADDSREAVFAYAGKQVDALQGAISRMPDGPPRRIGERKLTDLRRRINRGLVALEDELLPIGGEVQFGAGGLAIKMPGSSAWRQFKNFDDAHDFLDRMGQFPDAPEYFSAAETLPGFDGLPPVGGPSLRYNTERAPVEATGIGRKDGRERLGIDYFLSYFRATLPAYHKFAEKIQKPELYLKRVDLDEAIKTTEREYRAYMDRIVAVMKKHKFDASKRGQNVFYYQLEKRLEARLQKEIADGVSPENRIDNRAQWNAVKTARQSMDIRENEIAMLSDPEFRKVFDELGREFGVSEEEWSDEYISVMRRMKSDPDFSHHQYKPPAKMRAFFEELWKGRMAQFEDNFSNVVSTYVRLGMRKKYMAGPYEELHALINKVEPGEPDTVGIMRSQLNRDLEFVRGIPDRSQRALESLMGSVLDTVNMQFAKARNVAPGWAKEYLQGISMPPQDALASAMALQYAGSMGGRIKTYAFNGLQLMFSIPLLDGKHWTVGFARAMRKDAWKQLQEFHVLAPKGQLSAYHTGRELGGGMINRVAEMSLEPQRWTDNFARAVSFFGFHSQIREAATAFRKIAMPGKEDVDAFISKSGLKFLDPLMTKRFTEQFLAANSEAELARVIGQAAARLTEVTQFSFTKGSQPGLFKTGVGRLFGMYGTWPMNYVDYLRRIFANPQLSGKERMVVMSKFMALHYGIYAAGQEVGVNMSSQVFLGPAAYGGSPLFDAAISAPIAISDWNSHRGDEARRAMLRPGATFIPGYLAGKGWYEHWAHGKPLLDAMGFPTETKESQLQKAVGDVVDEVID